MPAEIVARILRLPGYGVYAWEAAAAANMLTLSIRQTGGAPSSSSASARSCTSGTSPC